MLPENWSVDDVRGDHSAVIFRKPLNVNYLLIVWSKFMIAPRDSAEAVHFGSEKQCGVMDVGSRLGELSEVHEPIHRWHQPGLLTHFSNYTLFKRLGVFNSTARRYPELITIALVFYKQYRVFSIASLAARILVLIGRKVRAMRLRQSRDRQL